MGSQHHHRADYGEVLAEGDARGDRPIRGAKRFISRRDARSRQRPHLYGKSHILHGVSIEVQPGEVVGLLGHVTGVGKSPRSRP